MPKAKPSFSRRLIACGTLAGLLTGGAAWSSQPRPPVSAPDSPIVVTGAPLSREQARERAVSFVRGTGVAAGDRSVARWVDPVCMNVIGVSADHARIVRARIERIARAAGVPVAGGNCENNFAVIFTTDANSVVRDVERRAPRRLSEVTGDDRARLLDSAMPIRWWYSTQPRSRHGTRQSTNSPAWTAGMPTTGPGGTNSAPSGGGSVLPDNVPNLYHYNSSIISTQAVRAIVSASVVIDVNQMRLPLEAVAAYVAMVGFAEIRENDFTSAGSILGMFAEEPTAPRSMTDWDLAFLRVLYRLPLDRDARRHRGILVRDLLATIETGVTAEH
jgi:hypothetical protein